MAALLADLALRAEHEAIFRAEREATRTDARNQAARAEDLDWDSAAGDGID